MTFPVHSALFFVFTWFFSGQANMIKFLIDHNAEYNSREYDDGNTPLHVATAHGLLQAYIYFDFISTFYIWAHGVCLSHTAQFLERTWK